MVTVAPTPAAVGLKLVIVGEGKTVKLPALVTITPLAATETLPVVAPAGTVVVILVGVEEMIVASMSLKKKASGVVPKLVPLITTDAPTAPLIGLKPVMVGVANTVKDPALVTVTPLDVTEIVPSVAPAGTDTVILVADTGFAAAFIPLNRTWGEAPKFVPLIITVAPIAPLVGLNPEITGVGNTVKFELLLTVMPLVVTVIFPVEARAGTVTVMEVDVGVPVTVAATSLKKTSGEGPKLVPLIVTVAPTALLTGLKLLIVGVGKTVKLDALVMVTPFTVIEIGPVAASAGTVVSIFDVVAELTTGWLLKNETAGVVRKFVPVIFTAVPTAPLAGSIMEIVGVGNTVKLEAVLMVIPFTVTEMGPVNAPAGTVVVMLFTV